MSMAAIAAMADAPLWLRDVAISPDGTTVAFTYKGDIYTVPVAGGRANRLTTSQAYDSKPSWRPDGKQIVFRSNREGSDDLYIMNALYVRGNHIKKLFRIWRRSGTNILKKKYGIIRN